MIRLVNLEIQNFRSIIGDPIQINFKDFTAVVGPNNSGKSNILRALNLFFCGVVESTSYTSELDYPKSGNLAKGDQTKITVTITYDPRKDILINRALDELEGNSTQKRLELNHLTLRLSYSKHGVESWQFIGKLGSKNINRALIEKVRDAVRQSTAFKYIPVGRNSVESINTEIGSELIRTIFSGWSGASRTRREINEAINVLLQKLQPELETSSSLVTNSVREVFKEIRHLKFRLPFTNLEEILPSLTAVINDSAETGLQSKGAGIQTSSLIFLLKYLADNRPQRYNSSQTFIWAIEEPESFLHPGKQREMAGVMSKFSTEVQTIITTHCPHFILRDTSRCLSWIVDKHTKQPHSTHIIGNDFESARQSLGVSLLDSMTLFPFSIIVEGVSDEIMFTRALAKLSHHFSIPSYDIKFIAANNATSAAFLFESLRSYNDLSTSIKLILDGDSAGHKALEGLLGRSRRDGYALRANQDYFQLPIDTENLISTRVKKILLSEFPNQIKMIENTAGKITSFGFNETHKKSLAYRAIEISKESDLINFKKIFEKIITS